MRDAGALKNEAGCTKKCKVMRELTLGVRRTLDVCRKGRFRHLMDDESVEDARLVNDVAGRMTAV